MRENTDHCAWFIDCGQRTEGGILTPQPEAPVETIHHFNLSLFFFFSLSVHVVYLQ